jgi:probable HAF family extracellular repeat protein
VIEPPAKQTSAFSYDRDAMVRLGAAANSLGTLRGNVASAMGINDSGVIVGRSHAPATPTLSELTLWFMYPGHAFVYRDGVMRDLNDLADAGSLGELRQASAISNNGHIVGFAHHRGSGKIHAFMLRLGSREVIDLGTFPGGDSSVALAVNSNGVAVGYASLPTGGEACVFVDSGRGRVAQNLNDMIGPRGGWVLRQATGINDRGQIVGWGMLGDKEHAFLLTPIR